MNGLELSEKYYNEYGRAMLESDFADILDRLAVGAVGEGSDCLGYDDEISEDHDFEPGFCIFYSGDIDRKRLFELERAYSRLPKEFMGYTRQPISPVGGNRRGVISADEFYISMIGKPHGFESDSEWLSVPDSYLVSATNGRIFRDDGGEFSRIRASLLNMPTDIRLKKLAGNLLMAAQAGQYNYLRCLSHGETGAAQLAAVKFTECAMNAIFCLNNRYAPFYKWKFRAYSELEILGGLSDSFEFLISSENDKKTSDVKYEMIEDISSLIIDELHRQKLTEATCQSLEKHAYSVNDGIISENIRNLNILYAVN